MILNWNGKKLLEQFLPSVIKYSKGADIYVADNASTDDSISFLEKNYPQVHLIINETNGGYAKGYNDALKLVNADILCLLNSDVEVTESWLEPIASVFSERKDVSIIQPKILDYNQKDCFEYAGAGGGFIDAFGYPFCRGRIFDTIEKDKGQYNNTTEIFWASGACFFIRKEVFDELNGFDEDYFAHQEEIDLCWRAKNTGHKTLYVGSSSIYHVGGATLKNSNPRKTFLNFRNSLFTLVKNLPSQKLFPIILIRLLLDGIAGLRFLFQLKFLHFIAIIKGHINFYRYFVKIYKKRGTLLKMGGYYRKSSIVWTYFVRNYKYYGDL